MKRGIAILLAFSVMLAAAAIGAAIPLPQALSPQKTGDLPDGGENAPGSATPDGEGERHA